MTKKDLRNTITDHLLSPAALPAFSHAIDAMIAVYADKPADELQPYYDIRGMLRKLAAETPAT